MIRKSGDSITSGNTAVTLLEISDALKDANGLCTAFIDVTSSAGGIKFGLNSIGANARLYVTDKKLIITFNPTVQQLYFQQTANGDTFSITV